MTQRPNRSALSKEHLKKAILEESKQFKKVYLWLEEHMPSSFFEEIKPNTLMLITHNLMSFHLQDYFSQIHLSSGAIVLCPDSPEADLLILKHYSMHTIRYYRTFVSNQPPDFPDLHTNLRIAIIQFSEEREKAEEILSSEEKKELFSLVKARSPKVDKKEFNALIEGMNTQFLRSMTKERMIIALDMFFRAKTRDHCQYEVLYNENWEEQNASSLRIVLAWKNPPKHNFLFRLAQTIYRHNLDMQRVAATYIDPYSPNSVLILSIALHGQKGKAAWEETDTADFLRELALLKYFDYKDQVETIFVNAGLLSGNLGNLLRTIIDFVHQGLVHADPNLYSLSHIEEGFCRHPELTVLLCQLFEAKFHPQHHNSDHYEELSTQFISLIRHLDTGHPINDMRRKNILVQGFNFVEYCLKTNFYRKNKTGFCFRLDPSYLDQMPYNRTDKFPELPFGIFFMKGMHFIGFHIRFKDLSRGGLRTIIPDKLEQLNIERNNVFSECYNLAYTQQKKNKDIPEGGAKGVILLEPFERMSREVEIYKREMQREKIPSEQVEENLTTYRKNHKLEFLYQAQKSYVHTFLTILNCQEDGTLYAQQIIDYWKKPEYIYLGPDENMHNSMIDWIANQSIKYGYKPGRSFITGKPKGGINHKEYGVTSFGVNVYMHQVLLFLGIDPQKDPFTVKISGGPDGDVAGNQILNLYKYYKDTAKLLAITDKSGTIYDPEGLDLETLVQQFYKEEPLHRYPPEKLHSGGFLLDLYEKREASSYAQQTLLYRKVDNELKKEWLSGDDVNHLFRYNVHQTITDIFIPAGGRPRTLNENNYTDFLDGGGKPTSKAIIEGANLYLTQKGRRALEKLGVLIIKDSSCNKGGVISSSLEVLASLVLSEEDFMREKETLIDQILEILKKMALNEANLLLQVHKTTQSYLTDISEWISQRINSYKYQLLDYLQTIPLSKKDSDPLIQSLFNYSPPLLTEKYRKDLLEKVPDMHKKAIIACYLASHLVYIRGLEWSPSIIDVLPLIAKDPKLINNKKP